MPLIRRSYLDLTPEQRSEGARVARERIQATLASPGLSKAQADALKAQLHKINQWVAGKASQDAVPVKSTGNTMDDIIARLPEDVQQKIAAKRSKSEG